jgi:hypothetical protein
MVLGIAIAAVDNFALGGEITPPVIILLLFISSAGTGALWGYRGWPSSLFIWLWLPLSHFVIHGLGLPDSIHPNTYMSIWKLAGFSLVITAIGMGCGGMVERMRRKEI